MNTQFTNALKRIPQAVPPIWFMRQAGRYHAHYQALRARHSFSELCKQPHLAAEVALGPVQEFDFDVAILFSDILFPLEAMGMGLEYDPAPTLGWHLNESNISQLRSVGEALPELQFQKLALQETRKVLPANKSLIGFVGAPWTLFTYAVEGSHKGGLEKAKRAQKLFQPFCETLLPLLEENIRLQFSGGAEVVMLFDTAAGELSPRYFHEMVVPSLARLANEFQGRLGYYAKTIQAPHLQHTLFSTKGVWAGLGFDHRWEISDVLKTYRHGFVQGNFDQSLLFLGHDEFKTQALKYLEAIGKMSLDDRAGWVSGLGHGVLPGTPQENVKAFVQLIREVLG